MYGLKPARFETHFIVGATRYFRFVRRHNNERVNQRWMRFFFLFFPLHLSTARTSISINRNEERRETT